MVDDSITFRPLSVADLPQLASWLGAPHVAEWWGDEPTDPESVEREYGPRAEGQQHVHMVIAELDGRPFGWLQWYRLGDEPEYALELDLDPAAVGIDMSIGEPDLVGRGLGRRTLRGLIEQVVRPAAPDLTDVFIDPDPANERAIRCYRAVGFVPTGDLLADPEHPGGQRLLMRRSVP